MGVAKKKKKKFRVKTTGSGRKKGSEAKALIPFKHNEELQKRFLDLYSNTHRLYESANLVNINPQTVYNLMESSPTFKAQVEIAKRAYADVIDAEIHRRAVDGVDKGIYYMGDRVATEKVYSDRLLELKGKRHIPEYREKISLDATIRAGVLVVTAKAQDIPAWLMQHRSKGNGHTVDPEQDEGSKGGRNGGSISRGS